MSMSFTQMQEAYKFNNDRRNSLLEEANKRALPIEKLKYVVDYFLNKLPIEEIAKVDKVAPENVMPFQYDYSFLQGYGEHFTRKQTSREYTRNKYAITLPHADNDLRVKPHIKIFPTVYATKQATCIMFAAELKRFAVDFGLDCEIIEEFAKCYDKYDGQTSEGAPLHTDRIIDMLHYYNIFKVDNEEFKIDIAGALMAMDFNKHHPDKKIDIKNYYFSGNLKNNPFNDNPLGSEPASNN